MGEEQASVRVSEETEQKKEEEEQEEELGAVIAALLVYTHPDTNNAMLAQFVAEDLHYHGAARLQRYQSSPVGKPVMTLARALWQQLDRPHERLTREGGLIETKLYRSPDSDDEDPYENPMIRGRWNRDAAARVFRRVCQTIASDGPSSGWSFPVELAHEI